MTPMSNGSSLIDFAGLSATLLSRSLELLPAWFPAGKLIGHEFKIGNLEGEAGSSLSINVNTGKWADFASDAKGGDLVSLYAAREGIKQIEAAKCLALEIGYDLSPHASAHRSVNDSRSNYESNIVKPPTGIAPPSMHHVKHGKPSSSWCYRDAAGGTMFYVARYDVDGDKEIIPWSWDGSLWIAKAWPAPRPLYGLDLLAAHSEAPVIVVEGEKAAEAARIIAGAVYVVVTWPNGAKAVDKADWSPLKARNVTIWPDADEAGVAAAQQIAAKLATHCPQVKILNVLSGEPLPKGYDAADALEDGWGLKAFTAWETSRTTIFVRTPNDPDEGPTENVAQGAFSPYFPFSPSQDNCTWPEPLGEAAYHGPAGYFVRLIEPHTEADPAALLIQFLVAFGNLIGRCSYFLAEADKHFTNLFALLVGDSSKARKGTSWGQVRARASNIDLEWGETRIVSGLSSGEGLIWAVRDPATLKGGETDPGVSDKRLLAYQPEFASVLRVLEREGNNLSAYIRDAWDRGSLNTLTKNNPAKATGAHVSIVGHIVQDELRRYLSRTENANGFANRFLFVCVRRSKLLPDGGNLDTVDFTPLEQDLQTAADFARRCSGRVTWDSEAHSLWVKVYEKLSESKPGLYGAATNRGESQVLRLALVYALLDKSDTIQKPHLEAALEVWRYAEDSARCVFGDTLGDPLADETLSLLRANPNGLTRTELSSRLAGHHKSNLQPALNLLIRRGLVGSQKDKTAGRWAARFYALGGYGGKGEEASRAPQSEAERYGS